ncbi:DUF29 domain-containing protein [Synechocystis sp. FACHB-383]|uniref:DUF29 domain-containing protein n=1 Tax=Synechocystis sp. FACHB-383 TaxID=2692864 RepID=UPI0016897D0A|nr:DUF29 domain-containing protein [Synechocystis sp. FACHB-383]MBD2653859.1 DUF29 domain-containing protein [Synechocystis sp. FACHB-383]
MTIKASDTLLYDQDFNLWLETMASCLKENKLEELDFENLAEEIQSINHIEKGILRENLVIILMHFLRWKYLPETWSNNWKIMIDQSRKKIYQCLLQSPSLREHFHNILGECYNHARKMVAIETGASGEIFPETNPFAEDEILDRTFLPDGFFPQYYEDYN